MTFQNNPELQKLTLELSREEADALFDALNEAHNAARKTSEFLHPLFATLRDELHLVAEKLGIVKTEHAPDSAHNTISCPLPNLPKQHYR